MRVNFASRLLKAWLFPRLGDRKALVKSSSRMRGPKAFNMAQRYFSEYLSVTFNSAQFVPNKRQRSSWNCVLELIFMNERGRIVIPVRVLEDSPIAYYRFDEAAGATVAVDHSGNGNDGTFSPNGVTLGVSGVEEDTADCLTRGRTSSRVTSRHFDHSNANLAFMSRSNRPYGLTCSHISGVKAA
jgi:hypothetical protein